MVRLNDRGEEMKREVSKETWKTASLPTNRIQLGFEECYSRSEFSLMKKGHKPEDMDDKWFIYFEEHWLYFCRSWTGYYIFGVKLEETDDRVCMSESWVNREPAQFNSTDVESDRKTLHLLISRILLTMPVPPQNQ
jgi:hypothetical protein